MEFKVETIESVIYNGRYIFHSRAFEAINLSPIFRLEEARMKRLYDIQNSSEKKYEGPESSHHKFISVAEELRSLTQEILGDRSIETFDMQMGDPALLQTLLIFGKRVINRLVNVPEYKSLLDNLSYYMKRAGYTYEPVCFFNPASVIIGMEYCNVIEEAYKERQERERVRDICVEGITTRDLLVALCRTKCRSKDIFQSSGIDPQRIINGLSCIESF